MQVILKSAHVNLRADISLDSSSRSAAPFTVGELQKSLYPLQATADRVGKQVEKFAETLDRLTISRTQQGTQDNCRDVFPIVLSYKQIAHDTVEQLKKAHSHEKQHEMTKAWKRKLRSSGNSTPKSQVDEDRNSSFHSALEDLKRWEQEEQTWELFALMLQLEFPTSQPDAQKPEFNQLFVRPGQGPDLHRYSSEKVVWNRFLADDDVAWERHIVVEWLKTCAETSGTDIELVVKDLESNADRGSGLESHSWLYTKEAIKGEKRLRALPQVLEPDTPGIEASLLDADRSKSLITQLDPDAVSRQGRGLEKQDHFFERAIWLACWEMVRRGKSWESIREWCQERVEGWRAIAMRGDPRASYSTDDTNSDDNSLTANWFSRALWRKTCALAAKRGGVDEYENAVYGALSGYLPSVKTVSESWNDYLFAHYNSYLLRQFDQYVKANFPTRLPKALLEKRGSYRFSGAPINRGSESGIEIVSKMKRVIRTSKEAREPFKLLQGSLIAKNFDEYLYEQGHQLALSADTAAKKQILPSGVADLLGDEPDKSITMDDHQMLRIVTHMIFIYQDLGMTLADDNRRIATENFIVAYIDYLRRAGKQQLLPLYAARLSPGRANSALGRQLAFIQDQKEREMLMRLMSHSGINILHVLTKHLQLSIDESAPNSSNNTAYPKIQILESTKDEKDFIYPIKKGFMGESMTGGEQSLINGFGWYLLLENYWQQTLSAGTVLYKYLLRK